MNIVNCCVKNFMKIYIKSINGPLFTERNTNIIAIPTIFLHLMPLKIPIQCRRALYLRSVGSYVSLFTEYWTRMVTDIAHLVRYTKNRNLFFL